VYSSKLKDKYIDLVKGEYNAKVRLMYDAFTNHTGDPPQGTTFETEPVKISNNACRMFDKLVNEIVHKINTFFKNGSGWAFSYNKWLPSDLVKYRPFSGGKGIKFPVDLIAKKGITNMKIDDEFCFMWCVTQDTSIQSKNGLIGLLKYKENNLQSSIRAELSSQLKLKTSPSLKGLTNLNLV